MTKPRIWVIGSAADCNVVVKRPNVSGQHCRLVQIGSAFYLDDLQSTNGTFVNGQRVVSRVGISKGDEILLGSNARMPWPKDAVAVPPPMPKQAPPPMPKQAPPPLRQGGRAAATVVTPAPGLPGGGPTRVVTVGREPDNDVVLTYPGVSAHHARIVTTGTSATIEDLGSTNGTFLNQRENRVQRAALAMQDIVFFGSFRVPAARLIAANTTLGAQSQETFSFSGQEMVFGRDPGCDQVLDYPMISQRHARLYKMGGRLLVHDLGSANGTFVNGVRVEAPVPIKPGDVIALGTYTFKLTESGNFEKRDYRGNVTIESQSVTVDVPGKRLLETISLTIYPSEFVGLMGPSGAGKTTLMNALNGYVPPSEGMVLFNGQDLYANYAQYATHLGYVPQDDIIHKDLTVGQALYYTARLRLPPDTSTSEISDRVEKVLTQLGLESTRNVLIGSPEKKGISGGQRKRVNLAMELLTDPSVLFLDEPTSGLSSEDALMVMKVLRELADSGKAILLTIHQPSLEAYQLMDNLVLVGKDQNSPDPGVLVFYGPAYPDAVHFFNPEGIPNLKPGLDPSPDEVLRGLAKRPTKQWSAAYSKSKFKRKFVTDRTGKRPAASAGAPLQMIPHPVGHLQWWTLVCRYLKIKVKDVWNTAILLVQAPVIALLIAMVFGDESSDVDNIEDWMKVTKSTSVTIFLTGLAALWFGCSNSVREIVGEWAIYHRERMINLKIPSYVGSKLAVLGGLCVIQCLTLVTIVYFGCSLEGNWFLLLIELLAVAAVGVALGLLISAVAPTSEVAIALLPLILLPLVIMGGMMRPVHEMSDIMQVAAFGAPTRWCYEAMLLTEVEDRERAPKPRVRRRVQPLAKAPTNVDDEPADMAEEHFPEDERYGIFAGIAVLVLMFCALIGSILFILRMRDVH